MTRKYQIKILDGKIESNINQYKIDRLNAEISAFSSGDLRRSRDGIRNGRNRLDDGDDGDDNLNRLINIKNKELQDSSNREKELQKGMYALRALFTAESKKYKDKSKELEDFMNREKELQSGIASLKDLYNSNKRENDVLKNKIKELENQILYQKGSSDKLSNLLKDLLK